MKNLITLIALLISLSSFAQSNDLFQIITADTTINSFTPANLETLTVQQHNTSLQEFLGLSKNVSSQIPRNSSFIFTFAQGREEIEISYVECRQVYETNRGDVFQSKKEMEIYLYDSARKIFRN